MEMIPTLSRQRMLKSYLIASTYGLSHLYLTLSWRMIHCQCIRETLKTRILAKILFRTTATKLSRISKNFVSRDRSLFKTMRSESKQLLFGRGGSQTKGFTQMATNFGSKVLKDK